MMVLEERVRVQSIVSPGAFAVEGDFNNNTAPNDVSFIR